MVCWVGYLCLTRLSDRHRDYAAEVSWRLPHCIFYYRWGSSSEWQLRMVMGGVVALECYIRVLVVYMMLMMVVVVVVD